MPFARMLEIETAIAHRIRPKNATRVDQRTLEYLLSLLRIVLGSVPRLVKSTRLPVPTYS